MSISTNIQAEVAGFFKIEAVNEETGERRLLADWFPNLILNQGLNNLGNGNNSIRYCQVGAGSTPPTVNDSQLQSFIASTGNIISAPSSYVAGPPYYTTTVFTYRFAAGTATGNLSEVGVGWSSSPTGSLFSRSLIKNTNGDPITIVVLSGEALDVSYEFRLYPPSTDSTFSVNIGGTNYDCIVRPSYISATSAWDANVFSDYGGRFRDAIAYDGIIGGVTGAPSGAGDGPYQVSTGIYSNNSYQFDGQCIFGLNAANFQTGIRSIYIRTFGSAFQCQFTPAIPKLNTQVLTLNFRVSWARRP